MYEIVILSANENSTWKIGVRPESLERYLKPGVFMVALYLAGADEHGIDPELLDYIYGGDTV